MASAPQRKCEITRDFVALTEYGLDVPDATARRRAGAALAAQVSSPGEDFLDVRRCRKQAPPLCSTLGETPYSATYDSLGSLVRRGVCAPFPARRIIITFAVTLQVEWKPPRRACPESIRLVTHLGGAACRPGAFIRQRLVASVAMLIISTTMRVAAGRRIDPTCQNGSAVHGTAWKRKAGRAGGGTRATLR